MKKKFILMAALVVLPFLLTACGGGKRVVSDTASKVESTISRVESDVSSSLSSSVSGAESHMESGTVDSGTDGFIDNGDREGPGANSRQRDAAPNSR